MMLSERLLAQGIVPVFERTLSDDGREPDAQGGRIPETCFFTEGPASAIRSLRTAS